MRLIAALAISVTVLAAQSSRTPMRSVSAVRHWSMNDVTRVAIEVSGEFEFRTDRLHNPERVYFDILNAQPRIAARRFYSVTVDDKLVKKVRVAETHPGVTRIVIDLAENVEATPSQLTNPDRLIVEVRPVAPSAPTLMTAAPISLPPATLPAVLKSDPVPPPTPPPSKTEAPVTTAKTTTEPLVVAAAKATAPASKPVIEPVTIEAKMAKAPIVETATTSRTSKTRAPLVETATTAKRTSTGSTSLVRALGLKIGRVVIDPGHGGHDQGTEGPKGLLEKDLVLDVSLRLGKLIKERMGAEVVFTRSDDTFIPLESRTAIANDRKADLFLSIHANSSPASRTAGVETYYRNMTSSKDALDVAARENATSQKSIFELEDLLHKVMMGDKVEESKEFAARVQSALYAFSAKTVPGSKDRGVKKAPFVVLAGAKSPSVLVEIGFLSNPKEEGLLRKPDYRQKLAEALYRGVARYGESLSHVQQVAKAGAE
jgi:N-acetylmuramoyl-L-alanine amidase